MHSMTHYHNTFRQTIKKYPTLSTIEEINLFKKYQQGSQKARDILIYSHMKLVIKIAFSYRHYKLTIEDLIEEGMLGLMRAIEKFDISKGYRLSTYANLWIRSFLYDYIYKNVSLVRLGSSANSKKMFYNLRRLKNKYGIFGNLYSHPQALNKISNELGIEKQDILDMEQRLSSTYETLHKTENPDNDNTTVDAISLLKSNDPSPEDILCSMENTYSKKKNLPRMLQKLNDRERTIIEKRYLCESPQTLAVLGKTLSLSKERIRQIEKQALSKLKNYIV